jgi:hypothetical protein
VNHRHANFAGRGDEWAIEVAFPDALLAVLDGESPALPADNPYAGVIELHQKDNPS